MAHLRALPVAMIIALGLGLVASAFAFWGNEFDEECLTQWDLSSASTTCGYHGMLQKKKGVCSVSAICSDSSGGSKRNNMDWTLDSMSKLVNNDGVLTGGVKP